MGVLIENDKSRQMTNTDWFQYFTLVIWRKKSCKKNNTEFDGKFRKLKKCKFRTRID